MHVVMQTPTGKGLLTHSAHRKTLLCPLRRVTRATASRAAAARGGWTAENWRVGPPQHSAPLSAAAAAATNRCLPAAWLPALTVRPLCPSPFPPQIRDWMPRCPGTTSTPASPSGGSRQTCSVRWRPPQSQTARTRVGGWGRWGEGSVVGWLDGWLGVSQRPRR
jgi:hypothetical protein